MTRILKATVVAVFTLAGMAAAQEPGAHFIESWDLDGDGRVTLAEAQERRGDVFYTFDADENGTLDAEEYAVFDEARANDMAGQPGAGRGAMSVVAEGMTLDANDGDGDGAVTEAEFLGAKQGWIAMIDQTGDGAVTAEDFAMLQKGQPAN
ncbi:MAG: calcium-binding protein [Rhodobacteraceae bacterium]|jgi:hypothetical protein|uniref:EF hand n=1 Tax=Salipiger profundus TaxID=1229727 RepID=A0A1U7D1H9_9RHOB|nr:MULTISPECIES: calcium-binding protein [Salipiger]APX22017.1 EF hand [Salipiger profundus]MAB08188.1 calcium-binding protein [Paracoccaceae bacterium]GGA06911.1 calcium-binding protein [Salipiger profundus]SFC41388.1 EF hand [Salipiger profundus]